MVFNGGKWTNYQSFFQAVVSNVDVLLQRQNRGIVICDETVETIAKTAIGRGISAEKMLKMQANIPVIEVVRGVIVTPGCAESR